MTITIRPIQNHVDPQVTQVTTRQLAIELAEHLLNPQRDRPVVLITRPKGHVAARFDVAQVSDDVGRLTDVYEMPDGIDHLVVHERPVGPPGNGMLRGCSPRLPSRDGMDAGRLRRAAALGLLR